MNEPNRRLMPWVLIALVNWNRYPDTLKCLDSLRKLNYPNYFVVVCDNGSQDGSVECFHQWAESNKINYRLFAAEPDASAADLPSAGSLTCIAGASNLGFAGANNLALRYALRLESVQYAWILNNDTVVDPAALGELVNAAEGDDCIGMCGSTVLQLDLPGKVQCLCGGMYNFWTGRTRHIGEGLDWEPLAKDENLLLRVEAQVDFVYGASMLVSRNFLQDVGLMSEDYFLYFEELDWAQRARGRYVMGYAPGSVVWHKEGASTLLAGGKKSEAADYYMIRNRVLFTFRYCHRALPFIFAGLLVSFGKRIFRGQIGRIPLLFKAMSDGVKAAGK